MKEEEENQQGERASGRGGYSSTSVDLGPREAAPPYVGGGEVFRG
jgi:hypothetical protein